MQGTHRPPNLNRLSLVSVTLHASFPPLYLFHRPHRKPADLTKARNHKMDTVIDARFERVEKALASLIESVAKYHPHTKQALDLHEADNDLSRGLDEGKRCPARKPHTFARMLTLRPQSKFTRTTTSASSSSARPPRPWTPRSATPSTVSRPPARTSPRRRSRSTRTGPSTPSSTMSCSTMPAASARPPCPRPR